MSCVRAARSRLPSSSLGLDPVSLPVFVSHLFRKHNYNCKHNIEKTDTVSS